MTAFANGTGGTITGVTNLEDWTVSLINFLRVQQGTPAKNKNNLRYLTVNQNTDGAISGSFNCPVTVAGGANGISTITAASYLTDVTYVAPTGGDSSAANEVQALIDAVLKQKNLELDTTTKNTTNANYLSWSVAMAATGAGTNAIISIGFSGLPVDMTQAANGSLNVEGRTYLS